MLRSLNSGISGIQQFQGRLDVIGNNIANSNTIAFKGSRVDFADALSQNLQGGSSGSPVQIGSGVSTAAVRGNFNQGAVSRTAVPSDMAISGEGFFMVRDVSAGTEYATRAGDFRVDSSGYLVTNKGLRVQGFSDSGLTTRGDLLIDGTGRPATSDPTASVTGYSVGQDGKITVRLSDGSEFVRAQVLLQNFRDPQNLMRESDNLFSVTIASGAMAQTEAPTTVGMGSIQSGNLELSNVDLASEFASLISTQRGFQANARIVTISDQVLEEVVNLKR